MSNIKMNQFVAGLKSRHEETRVKAACDLQRYVTTELREVRHCGGSRRRLL